MGTGILFHESRIWALLFSIVAQGLALKKYWLLNEFSQTCLLMNSKPN